MAQIRRFLPLLLVAVLLVPVGAMAATRHGDGYGHHTAKVQVPDEDRFAPFAVVIHVGDIVKWKNNDTDDHTVVSDDAFDTAGHRGTDQLLPAGQTFALSFSHPGVFVYYCRFHAHLDEDNQPAAPGPDGGIQDPNGNFGTPMSGVITVLP
jgi:plastocyanin